MSVEDPTAPDIWEDRIPPLPARSRLYPIAPIGLETGEVESLTSYLSRLAIAHTVSTWTLLKCEIAPALYGPEAVLRNRLSELVAAMGSAFNGDNKTCRKVASILNSLTQREDLLLLSMAFCRGFVSSRLLMRRDQAWCPVCLSEWKGAGGPLYWPLLWNLLAVRVCPRHRVPLVTVCPDCGRSFYPLMAHSRPGYCPRCGAWLGGEEVEEAATQQILAADQQIAERVHDFLNNGPAALAAAKISTFSQNTETLKRVLFDGNALALARFAGVNRFTIVAWTSARQLPSLLSLGNLSLRVGTSPEALLCRRLQPNEFAVAPEQRGRLGRRLHKLPPKHDLEQMRHVLEDAVQERVFPRRSLSALAAQLGCFQTTLDRRFPELAKKVKDLYKGFEAIRKEVRSKLVRGMVRMSTIDLHKAGQYPSMHRVGFGLPSFIDMRDRLAYEEWKRTMTELDLPDEHRKRDAA